MAVVILMLRGDIVRRSLSVRDSGWAVEVLRFNVEALNSNVVKIMAKLAVSTKNNNRKSAPRNR